MAEQIKSKRVEFPLGKQKEFILKSKKELGLTWKELSKITKTSTRNLTGWKNEKNSMSFVAVENICRKRNCVFPENIKIKDPFWYVQKGAIAGGKANYEKHGFVGGDEKKRKEKWQQWWEQKGRFDKNEILKPLPFRKPKFSKELAEFVGIVLGDGGISDRQITVTLHRITDSKYSEFVKGLIKKLFNVTTGNYCKSKFLADSIVISRTGIVNYLTEIGLKKGNKIKHQVDIPGWVKNNEKFKIACLRGLIDTDGCIIIHRYKSKGKMYCYKKIEFTSRSHPLLTSASVILKELGIKHRIAKNNFDIRIEAKKDVDTYFKMVGTHNEKHLNRFRM